MKPYHIIRMEKPDWNAAEKVELTHQPWLTPCAIRAWAQLCHDGENLYVRMEAEEENIRATVTDALSAVCADSCLEFFFAPMAGDKRYLNFELNKLGTAYVGFGAERKTRMRLILKNPADLLQPMPFETDKGWGIEFRIPATFVKLFFPEVSFSGEAAGNFYKCGDLTETEHYLAWSPMTSETPDFHRRQDFGTLVFE